MTSLDWHDAVQRRAHHEVIALFQLPTKPQVDEMCPVSKKYAIEIAVRETQDFRMVQLLLQLGANPRYSRSGSLLQAAVSARQFEIADLLERYFSSSERVAVDYDN
jgi:hypothetical protein